MISRADVFLEGVVLMKILINTQKILNLYIRPENANYCDSTDECSASHKTVTRQASGILASKQ